MIVLGTVRKEVFEHASGRVASTVDVRFWRGMGHVADDWPQRHLSSHHARASLVLL